MCGSPQALLHGINPRTNFSAGGGWQGALAGKLRYQWRARLLAEPPAFAPEKGREAAFYASMDTASRCGILLKWHAGSWDVWNHQKVQCCPSALQSSIPASTAQHSKHGALDKGNWHAKCQIWQVMSSSQLIVVRHALHWQNGCSAELTGSIEPLLTLAIRTNAL